VLRFEWNALRQGDHVIVHDPRTDGMTLVDGVVTGVDTHRRVNGVGIRVGAPGGGTAVLWLNPFVVHHDPRDPTEPCWRCEELAERAAPPLKEHANPATVGADEAARLGPALGLSGMTPTPR
jgi:hypothetical protein